MSDDLGDSRSTDRIGNRGRRWRLADLFDLDALLIRDEASAPGVLEDRDGAWGREFGIRTDRFPPPAERERVLRWWLERRRAEAGEPLPGEVFERARRRAGWVLAVLGFAAGAGASRVLLAFDGTAPVNVSGFLFVLVGGQALLLLLTVGLTLRRWRRGSSSRGPVAAAAVAIWRGALGLIRRVRPAAGGPSPEAVDTFFRERGTALYWPLVRLSQIGGVGFNLGALVAMLLILLVGDRAFGWQSTLIREPETLSGIIEFVATPWSGLFPDAVPSAEAVAGSRIVLKDGVEQLASTNLQAWVPFLIAALCTYGLFPRLVLWGVARVGERWSAAALPRESVRTDAVIARMRSGNLDPLESTDRPEGPVAPDRLDRDSALAGSDAIVICEEGPGARRWVNNRGAVERLLGFGLPVFREYDPVFPGGLDDALGEGPHDRYGLVVVVCDGALAPVAEQLDAMRGLRARVGTATRLAIVLHGAPDCNGLWGAPPAAMVSVWRKRFGELGDRFLTVAAVEGGSD